MVSVETFIDYIKKKDIARIRFSIRDSNFDIDTRDEVSSTVYHYNKVTVPGICHYTSLPAMVVAI